MAAAAVALAAIGWGIIEPLLPAQSGARAGVSPTVIGLIFTIASITYGLSAPLVSWVSNRVPIRGLIAGGTVAMALALPLLSLYEGRSRPLSGYASSASAMHSCSTRPRPSSATRSTAAASTCYAAVYAIYNIAYAVGQMASSGFASAASTRLSFFQILLSVGVALLVFTPLLLLKGSPPPQVLPNLDAREQERTSP